MITLDHNVKATLYGLSTLSAKAFDMSKPEFIIIGAAKCGSTYLHSLLGTHPQIGMSTPKETNFFAFDKEYEKGWDYYERFFPTDNVRIRGESSHFYSLVNIFPKTVDRIRKDLPEIKLIYIIRNPLRRMESAWRHLRISNPSIISEDFNQAVFEFAGLVEGSRYWNNISAYRTYYSDSSILILFLEDLMKNEQRTLNRCAAFLGVDPALFQENERVKNKNDTASREATEGLSTLANFIPTPAKRMMPKFLKKCGRDLCYSFCKTRSKSFRPEWTAKSLGYVAQELEDDSRNILEHCQKEPDLWPDWFSKIQGVVGRRACWQSNFP